MLLALAAAALALLSDVPSDAAAGTLSVLDKSDATAPLHSAAGGPALLKLPTGTGPHEVAVSPDGRTAVVCDYGAGEAGSTLTVLDLETLQVVDRSTTGRQPDGMAWSPLAPPPAKPASVR